MKIETFRQPIITDDQRKCLEAEKRVFANAPAYECRFLYNLKDRTIYDVIMNDSYRMNSHSLVFSVHDNLDKFDKDCVRLSFCTERYAKGGFMWNDLGITGLRISELYGVQYGLDKEILNRLTKQDLDNIENYCIGIATEWYSMQNKE